MLQPACSPNLNPEIHPILNRKHHSLQRTPGGGDSSAMAAALEDSRTTEAEARAGLGGLGFKFRV